MRAWIVVSWIGLAGVGLVACDDGAADVAPARLRFSVPFTPTAGGELELCSTFEVRGSDGTTLIAAPEVPQAVDETRAWATSAAAVEAGARCSTSEHDAVFESECTPGVTYSLRFDWLAAYSGGALDVDVAPLGPSQDADATVTCVAGQTVDVDPFELTLVRNARQGFVDIGVNGLAPAPLDDVCYAMRVTNGADEPGVVWAEQPICASKYGTPSNGTVSFVGTCDAKEPETEVTLWVTDIDSDAAIANPCPAPTGEGEDPATWSGGCKLVVTCEENVDVLLQFNVSFQPPADGF